MPQQPISLPDIVIESYTPGVSIPNYEMGGYAPDVSFKQANQNAQGNSGGMPPGTGLLALQIGGAAFQSMNILQQRKQLKYNAKTNAMDIDNRIAQEMQDRKANAVRETRAGTRRLAQIESGYARSGVEMSGDVANYVAQVAAVQEQNIQQRNQDMFHLVAVMEVQKQNMLMAAKQKEKGMLLAAATNMIGAGISGYSQYSSTQNYWNKYGATKDAPKQSNDLSR